MNPRNKFKMKQPVDGRSLRYASSGQRVKLSDRQVQLIRDTYAQGKTTQKELAEHCKVTPHYIYIILSGRGR